MKYHWNEEKKLDQKRHLLKVNYLIFTKDSTTHLQIIEQGPGKICKLLQIFISKVLIQF